MLATHVGVGAVACPEPMICPLPLVEYVFGLVADNLCYLAHFSGSNYPRVTVIKRHNRQAFSKLL